MRIIVLMTVLATVLMGCDEATRDAIDECYAAYDVCIEDCAGVQKYDKETGLLPRAECEKDCSDARTACVKAALQ